jgi:arylsulfatase A-like enzyme
MAVDIVLVVYAAASIQIFAYLRSPLTYPLLCLAGGMADMRSSVGHFLTGPLVAGLVSAPALFLLGVALCSHWSSRWSQRHAFLRRALGAAALAAGLLWAGYTAQGSWADRDDHLIVANPHWTLLASWAVELSGGHAPPLADTFGPQELADFEPPPPAPLAPAAARLRNVILVVLESTGVRYLGLYGSHYDTTPHLGAEAVHALVIDNAYAHVGLSANSLAAITLSMYPYMSWREYTAAYPTFPGTSLAQLLKPLGYRTAFMESADLDYVGQRRFLEGRGYDVLWDVSDLGGAAVSSWGGEDRALVDGVFRFIDQEPGRPFFAMAWTCQSHHPYEPVPGQPIVDFFKGGPLPPDDYDLGRYLNTIAEVDRQMQRLLDGLRQRGLAEDTLVVFTGDHGEAFGDPHPTWGHGARVYEENVHVPLMVWSPRLYPSGRRASLIAGHVDVNPTIAGLLGIPPAPSWEGRSLFAPARPPRTYFYAANDDYLLGVREGDWKYVYNATRGRDELFHLPTDPDELKNRAAEEPDRCQGLRRRLAAWKDHAGRRLAAATAPQRGATR